MDETFEVVRCLCCGKETYARLADCPHCKAKLTYVDPRHAKAPKQSVRYSFEEFLAGLNDGSLRVNYDVAKIGSSEFYMFAPRLFSLEMLARFFGIPALVFVFLYFQISVPAQGTDFHKIGVVALALLWIFLMFAIRRVRERFVRRRIRRSAKDYVKAVECGLIEVFDPNASPVDEGSDPDLMSAAAGDVATYLNRTWFGRPISAPTNSPKKSKEPYNAKGPFDALAWIYLHLARYRPEATGPFTGSHHATFVFLSVPGAPLVWAFLYTPTSWRVVFLLAAVVVFAAAMYFSSRAMELKSGLQEDLVEKPAWLESLGYRVEIATFFWVVFLFIIVAENY